MNCWTVVAVSERLMPAIRTADCRSPLIAELAKATDVDETRFEVRGQVSGLAQKASRLLAKATAPWNLDV